MRYCYLLIGIDLPGENGREPGERGRGPGENGRGPGENGREQRESARIPKLGKALLKSQQMSEGQTLAK